MPSFRFLLRDLTFWIVCIGLVGYTYRYGQAPPRITLASFSNASSLAGLQGHAHPEDFVWKPGAPMTHERRGHRLSVLEDGRILVSGGLVGVGSVIQPNRYLSSSELYDPQQSRWRLIPNLAARFRHTSTALPSGEVILIGGQSQEEALASTEIFDPQHNRFRPGPELTKSRRLHTATLLANGRILVAGGYSGSQQSTSFLYPYGPYQLLECEEIDPVGSTPPVISFMERPRELHSATRLADGRVLVAGGVWGDATLSACEIYDPKRRTWQAAAPMKVPRTRHTATLLPDGRVLVIGGSTGKAIDQTGIEPIPNVYASCEIYDPKADRWTLTDSLHWPRTAFMDALVLPNQTILVAGGFGSGNYASNETWELFDLATETWSVYGSWQVPLHGHRLAYLPSVNQVFRVGGLSKGLSVNTTSVWDLTTYPIGRFPKLDIQTYSKGQGPETVVDLQADFDQGVATITPDIGPVSQGQRTLFSIQKQTQLTLTLDKRYLKMTRRFQVQPAPPNRLKPTERGSKQ